MTDEYLRKLARDWSTTICAPQAAESLADLLSMVAMTVAQEKEMSRAEAQGRFLSMRQQRDDVLNKMSPFLSALSEWQAAERDFYQHRLDTVAEDHDYGRRFKRLVDAEERWMRLLERDKKHGE